MWTGSFKPCSCLYCYNHVLALLHSVYLQPATNMLFAPLLSVTSLFRGEIYPRWLFPSISCLNFSACSSYLVRSSPSLPVQHCFHSIVHRVFCTSGKHILLFSKLGSSIPASGKLFVFFSSSGMSFDFLIVQELSSPWESLILPSHLIFLLFTYSFNHQSFQVHLSYPFN